MTHQRAEYGILTLILAGYLLLGWLYATQTAAWQAPDEPAHYNYVAQLAENGCCPVIEMGDWDNDYLETLKAARFAPNLTTALPTIQYEDHQPPLYYLLAAVVYRLTGGSLVALRLFSVTLGLGVVLCGYGVARITFPRRRGVALGTAALVAFIPQHIAILASVNNDALAYLLAAGGLLIAAAYVTHRENNPRLRGGFIGVAVGLGLLVLIAGGRSVSPVVWLIALLLWAVAAFISQRPQLSMLGVYSLLMGVVVGLAFVTKTTVYFLVGVMVLAVGLRPVVLVAETKIAKGAGVALKVIGAMSKMPIPRTDGGKAQPPKRRLGWRFGWSLLKNARQIYEPVYRRNVRAIASGVAVVVGVALAFGVVWWGRNLAVYGMPDALGLVAHDEVVVGQLRTPDQIAAVGGFSAYLSGAWQTTFNSFWGQFGWMALPLPPNWYPVIWGLLGFSAAGIVLDIVRGRAKKVRPPTARQVIIGVLLGAAGLAAAAQFIIYNLTFYQVQGRYLFVAIIPFALMVAAGFDAWTNWGATRLRGYSPQTAQLMRYVAPLALAAGFGAANLWLVRFVLPLLTP